MGMAVQARKLRCELCFTLAILFPNILIASHYTPQCMEVDNEPSPFAVGTATTRIVGLSERMSG